MLGWKMEYPGGSAQAVLAAAAARTDGEGSRRSDMRRTLFAAGVLAMTLAAGADDAPRLDPGDHARTFASTWDGTQQPFRMFVPQAADPAAPLPLVVVLHGKGVDQNAWFDLTPVKQAAEQHGFAAVAPHGRGNFWYRGAAEQDVLDIVAEAKRLLPIDPARVHLTGHSMGGWGTWWISARQPDQFATACPLSGFPPRDMMPSARHLDPFLIHDETDPIVPVEFSREPVAILASLGIGARYREERGYGHGSKLIGDNFDLLFPWFEAHAIPERPGRVSLAVRTPRKGRAWWIDVRRTERFPSTATIDALLAKDGTVAIAESGVAAFALQPSAMPLEAAPEVTPMIGDLALGKFPASTPWILCEKIDDAWRARAVGELPPIEIVPVACAREAEIAAMPQDDFARLVGNVLREEAGAEAALLDRFDANWQGVPLTLDRLADTWCYPVESLAIYAMTGAELRAFTLREPGGLLAVLPDGEVLDDKRTYRTLGSTRPIQGLPPAPIETVALRPDEILVRRALRTGQFP